MEHQEQARVAPCMGGRCGGRTGCEHYVNPTDRNEPAERLCRGMTEHFIPLGGFKAQRAGVPA